MGLININSNKFDTSVQNYFALNNYQKQDPYTFWNNTQKEPEFNENLKLRYGQPEIRSESNLPEEKLIQLKQSPARQQISLTLKKCDDKVFNCTKKDCDKMNIIIESGIGDKFNFNELVDKFLISKTNKIISVIQGTDKLDTGNMTEIEMQAKANKFSQIVEQARAEIEAFRDLLDEGVELAKELSNENSSNKNKKDLNDKIIQYGQKFTAFVQSSTTNDTNSSKNTENKTNK